MTPDREPKGRRNPSPRSVFQGTLQSLMVCVILVLFQLALWGGSLLSAPWRGAGGSGDLAARAAGPVESPGASPGAHVITRDGRPEVLLTREYRGACVDVRTDCDLNPKEYADLGDRVLPRLRRWFGDGQVRTDPSARYTIFLCSSVQCMLEVERLCGEPSSQIPGRTFAYRGGFYPRPRVALIPPGSRRLTCWLVAHELSHAAFFERVGNAADPIDEGLAEVLPDWLLFSNEARPEDHSATYPRYESCCGSAMLRSKVPTLSWLCALDYWGFRDDRIEDLGFASSWVLAKLLVESREPGIEGRVQGLLTNLSRGRSLREALSSEFGWTRIEQRWHEWMSRWAEWEPSWGTWTVEGRDWSTRVATWGSNLLLAHAQPGNSAFELGFTWHTPSSEYGEIGFALGMRDEGNLAVLSLNEFQHRVLLEVLRGGELERQSIWLVPNDLKFDCQSIVLTCGPGARAMLRIGEFSLPLDEVDSESVDGRCGLVAELPLFAARRVVTNVTFQDPWNTTRPALGQPVAASSMR